MNTARIKIKLNNMMLLDVEVHALLLQMHMGYGLADSPPLPASGQVFVEINGEEFEIAEPEEYADDRRQ